MNWNTKFGNSSIEFLVPDSYNFGFYVTLDTSMQSTKIEKLSKRKRHLLGNKPATQKNASSSKSDNQQEHSISQNSCQVIQAYNIAAFDELELTEHEYRLDQNNANKCEDD